MRKENTRPLFAQDQWQQIMDEINYAFMPSEYVSAARVSFNNGKTWEIDLATVKYDSIEELIEDIHDAYEDHIKRLDFKINLEKVKRDVSEETDRFLTQS